MLNHELENEYRKTAKVKITPSDIFYVVFDNVEQLGGGESSVFHEGLMTREFLNGDVPVCKMFGISVRENKNEEFKKLDIFAATIEQAREKCKKILEYNFFEKIGGS